MELEEINSVVDKLIITDSDFSRVIILTEKKRQDEHQSFRRMAKSMIE